MKQRLLTPGPSPVPEETLLELAKPVFYHRSAQFRQLLNEVLEDLKYVYCTKQTIALLTASGTGGMEAAVANCLAPGSKAIVAVAGKFGERWRSIGKAFGVEVVSVTVPYGQAVQPEQIEQAVQQHPDAAAVCATLSETSTGVRHDIQAFGKIVSQTPALYLVDGISGLGVAECRTDDWHLDVCVTGSQKALDVAAGPGLPVGQRKSLAAHRSKSALARLLFRPAQVPRQPQERRHAVHAGAHAGSSAAGEFEAVAGRGHRERMGAARRAWPPPAAPACRR